MISVVIPSFNEVGFIDQTLTSLLASEDPGEPWEVIVVDGGSTDGTREKLMDWDKRNPHVTWIDNPKRVTPVAMNIGIRAAQGETVLILGAHSEVSFDFLRRNADAMRTHPESACVGGIVEQVHGSEKARRIGAALSTPFGVGDARFRTGGPPGHVDTVAFGCYRKSVLEEIGGFDEDLVRNQDDELNFRLTELGWRIWFDPRIRSRYHVRSSFGKLFRQYKQYGYWKVFVNRKHKTITTWRQVIPALFIVGMLTTGFWWLMDVMGWVGSAWSGVGRSVHLSIVALWLIGAIGSAWTVAQNRRDIAGVVQAFLWIHIGYGWGYLEGIGRFLILRASPRETSTQLTR
ncbi:MAG: glycosyltransferase family 2 protein [Flavobacteriales bacterium]